MGNTPQERWIKANTTAVNVRLMKTTERDLIEWLAKQPNKAGYIKSLIRADMNRK